MECIAKKKNIRKVAPWKKNYQEPPCSPEGMNTSCVYMQLGKKCFTLDKVA
jgi:hypothetical protein